MKLADDELEKIDNFLTCMETTTFPGEFDRIIKLLAQVARLFKGLHEEAYEEVERLKLEHELLRQEVEEKAGMKDELHSC